MNLIGLAKAFDARPWKKLGHWKKSFMLDWIEATSLGLQHFQRVGLNWHIDNYAFVAHTAMMGEDDFVATKRYYEEQLASNHRFAFEHAERCYRTGNALLEFSTTLLDKTDWSHTSEQHLAQSLGTFVSLVSNNIPFFPPLVALEQVLDERIRLLLASRLEELNIGTIHLFDYLSTFSTPKRTPDMLAKREVLLGLGERIQSDKSMHDLFLTNDVASLVKDLPKHRPDLWNILTGYVRNFGWLATFGWLGTPFNESDVVEELKDLIRSDCKGQINTIHSERDKAEHAIQRALSELKPSDELTNLIDVIREYAYLRLFRIDIYNKAYFQGSALFQEVARRLTLSPEEVMFLTPSELMLYLESGRRADLQLIRSRERGFTILNLGGELSILAGDAFESFEQSRQKEEYGDLTEVKGDPVFKGNASGVVKVVMDSSALSKVNPGDILVAPMTNPDFTAVFGKIAGIITDEGGILCHAAIVAREYKLPCIISTKIGTKVFRDEDFVHLDATEGKATKTARPIASRPEIETERKVQRIALSVAAATPGDEFIHWLAADGDETFPQVGSKFRNLAILHRRGFPIPSAFCLGTGAFRRFLSDNGLTEQINKILSELDFDNGEQVNELSSQITALIVSAQMPTSLLEAIRRSLTELASSAVCVRSSSTSEDLALASFAGVYDSFLNVIGIDGVLQKIKACWASPFSDRALYYYYEQVKRGRLPTPDVAIAVIVQELIHSEKSGICFTANPESFRRDEIVIQAAYGLGEGTVSGQVPSDVYVVGKTSLHVLTRTTAERYSAIVPDRAGGVREIEINSPAGGNPVLSAAEAADLAGISIRVEEVFGSPQDIEWAKDRDAGFVILQSRPITTVPGDGL